MSIFKCKMCGGDLEINEGVTIAECEYCGTKQTVPKAMDENLQNLFNRANTLRIKSEFDKAEKLYEKIIQTDPTQSEAYWGLILCKYGIEYVDDPATYKKIPTCHRASYDSIIADDDYKSAMANADMSQRAIYEEQAREIDRIQKEILALAQKEETYDVFICYKETDANGQRTHDSVIANDIYYQLKQEGFKVFYAAITLEGKLGSAYEPIIFAALNSAKVMLTIGTKPEYFNAVWVKNEWSRFLKIIKKDRSKLLIPCYRDMDAYELPDEFAHLQAQDMSKIGFINDIVRGIKKVIHKEESKPVASNISSGGNTNTASLLKRAYIFLSDEEWQNANDYCEKVLDNDPENAEAYLGKLMAELHVRHRRDLADYPTSFDTNKTYKKVLRYADTAMADELNGYISDIKDRLEKEAALDRKEKLYVEATKHLNSSNEDRLIEGAKIFRSLDNYKDSAEKAVKCEDRLAIIIDQHEEERKNKLYIDAMAHLNSNIDNRISLAIGMFTELGDYKNSAGMVDACYERLVKIKTATELARKNNKFNEAKNLLVSTKESDINEAIKIFESLDDFNDSRNMVQRCHMRIEELREMAVREKERQERQKEMELLEKERLEKKVKQKRIFGIVGIFVAILVLLAGIFVVHPWLSYLAGDYKVYINMYGIEEFQVPDGVTNITEYAFYECKSLKKVTLPDSVTNIDSYSFQDCDALETVEFSDSLKTIDYYAFYGCDKLTEVTIPDSVTYIGSRSFSNCASLKTVRIGDSVTYINDFAFGANPNLEKVYMGNSVEIIGQMAFHDCGSLSFIEIPESVKTIGRGAFENCLELSSVRIPDQVENVGYHAFYSCPKLVINCEADSRPSGWDVNWFGSVKEQHWGR